MILDLALRAGVVMGVVMATKHYGIWESSDETQEFYSTTTQRLKPYAKQTCDYLNIHVPALPPQREKSFLFVHYYNEAVKTVLDFLNMSPTYVHDVLEKVPGIVSKYAAMVRERYEQYKRQRALEKQKEARKKCIDDKQLVQPLKPHPDSKCKCNGKYLKESNPGLMPKDAPASPYKDGPCPKAGVIPPPPAKQYQPDKKCDCPKCALRESQGWSDNKPQCPKRNVKDCRCKEDIRT